MTKQSETKRERFSSGEIHIWNEGKAKETDSRLLAVSDKLKEKFKEEGHHWRFSKEEFDEIVSSQSTFELISSYEDYRNRDDKLTFKCKTCLAEQLKDLKQLKKCPVCFKCHPKGSAWQVEIYNFVKEHCPDVESSNRKVIAPHEIDVYVPSAKFGIECNGLFYHCEYNENFEKDHLDRKTNKCLSAGIKLLHIFEDEWEENKELVKDMILHRIGIFSSKIDARKCEIVELDARTRRDFFVRNHLDGDVKSLTSWGLVLDGKIVAALSVKTPYQKIYSTSLEVARFACEKGINVRGALGRLLEKAEEFVKKEKYTDIITYVDRRIGEGTSYEKVGFEKVKETSLRFWWTDRKSYRIPREKIQAGDGRSERKNADIAGVCKIFGCKNYLFKKTIV